METERMSDYSCSFFSLLFCFSFWPPPHINVFLYTTLPFHAFIPFLHSTPFSASSSSVFFGLLHYVLHFFFFFLPLLFFLSYPSCQLFLPLYLSYILLISLSQITVSVAQGRVRSPSPQPRYKSYAYTQAAYVKSPEQKRRRFTDQVRVSQR